MEPGVTSHADTTVSSTIDNLLLKASWQLERSLEKPVQQVTTQEALVEASQLLQGLEPATIAVIDDLLLSIVGPEV